MSLSTRIILLGAVLVAAGCGVAVFLLQHSTATMERELLRGEAALARLLGGLKQPGGKLDFEAIKGFVEHSDQPEVSLGLVYAIEVDRSGAMVRGELNPRLFASLAPRFRRMMLDGRDQVLRQLAAGKVDRSDRIRELSVGGQLRLGFDLARIDRQVSALHLLGAVASGSLLVLGLGLVLVLARWSTAPLRALARQAAELAAGEGIHRRLEMPGSGPTAQLSRAFDLVREQLAVKVDAGQQLAPYLGQRVMDRVLGEDNPLELTAEERAVTVLALGFRGTSTVTAQGLGAVEALRLTNDYLAPVIDAIVDRGGTVVQLDVGRLVAVWGFPTLEKEPERAAIKAALASRAAARQEGRRQSAIGSAVLDPCIGIASGRTVGGNLGSARRVTYTVVGGAAELAGLIEQQARPGEILVNEAAFDKIRGVVNGSACAPLMDGMDEAVPLYRLTD